MFTKLLSYRCFCMKTCQFSPSYNLVIDHYIIEHLVFIINKKWHVILCELISQHIYTHVMIYHGYHGVIMICHAFIILIVFYHSLRSWSLPWWDELTSTCHLHQTCYSWKQKQFVMDSQHNVVEDLILLQ